MIYLDKNGFPVDQTGDGGDSAVRAAILANFDSQFETPAFYVNEDGHCARHPFDIPWNNPKNFSRDQLIPLTSAMRPYLARRVFWSHAKRLFFCQNFERDYEGSKKYPWPHKIKIGDAKDIGKWRAFDFADLLMPDHVYHLIRCARVWWLYWFALVAVPWFVLSLKFHSHSSHTEHNQIICQAKVIGPWGLRLFKKWVPTWKEDLRGYWGKRNEIEYAELIITALEK